ncbi:MAG: DsrE family protein [Planctomycetes bacterium]|nr:DsrE family protein [Planctomycetota bacterium]MBM4081744.1 DsrE family protein [Planctomycetota bacterium]MBM4087201.1 DsrE family protein [Planctomycetota bacterium]
MIVIILTTGPESRNTATAIGIARGLLRRGRKVCLFLMSQGVLQADNPLLKALVQEGATVTGCEHDAGGLGVASGPEIKFGSMIDLGKMMSQADKVICL